MCAPAMPLRPRYHANPEAAQVRHTPIALQGGLCQAGSFCYNRVFRRGVGRDKFQLSLRDWGRCSLDPSESLG